MQVALLSLHLWWKQNLKETKLLENRWKTRCHSMKKSAKNALLETRLKFFLLVTEKFHTGLDFNTTGCLPGSQSTDATLAA